MYCNFKTCGITVRVQKDHVAIAGNNNKVTAHVRKMQLKRTKTKQKCFSQLRDKENKIDR